MRQINLLPESLQQAQNKKKILNSFFVTLIPTVFAVGAIHILTILFIANLEGQVKHPAANMDTMEFMALREEIQKKADDLQKYTADYGALINSYMDNYLSQDILRAIGAISHHKVWFTRFELNNKNRACEIQGKSFNTRLVSEFMLGVKKAPFFDNVTLISMEKGQDEKVNFKIVCVLK